MAKDRRKSVRMSVEEEKIIYEKAELAGMNFSEYVRKASLNQPVTVVPGIKELHLQVAKIGNNLNQLTMLCHQGSIMCPNIDATKNILNEVYQKLYEISEEINNGNISTGTG